VTKLSVNLNKIALIRNSRPGNYPDLMEFARLCLDHDISGITVHPRPDQRHIRATDIPSLCALLKDCSIPRELNIEGNPFSGAEGDYPGFLALVESVRPQQCTLVPDHTHQLTSDHGFNLRIDAEALAPVIKRLQQHGIRVSLFMDAEEEQIQLAAELGANCIELYTGPFAQQFQRDRNGAETLRIFEQHCRAAEKAHQCGLRVHAGHDLNRDNLALYKKLPYLAEVSIGHAIIVDALLEGMSATVRSYLDALA